MLHFLSSCSYLFTFLLVAFHYTALVCNYCFFTVVNKISIYSPIFSVYWRIRLESTAYFFDPPCIVSAMCWFHFEKKYCPWSRVWGLSSPLQSRPRKRVWWRELRHGSGRRSGESADLVRVSWCAGVTTAGRHTGCRLYTAELRVDCWEWLEWTAC